MFVSLLHDKGALQKLPYVCLCLCLFACLQAFYMCTLRASYKQMWEFLQIIWSLGTLKIDMNIAVAAHKDDLEANG